jgi:cytochrome P450
MLTANRIPASLPHAMVRTRPPGPKSPFALGSYLAFYRDPLRFLSEGARKYGDIAHMQLGSRHDYLINHPDYVKEVLLAPRGIHRSFPLPMKILLRKGLLTSHGEFHRRQRRLLQPAFHKEQIAACGAGMVECATRTSDRWENGDMLEIAGEMLGLTLAIVVKTLFGSDVEREAKELGDSWNTIVAMTHKNTFPFLDQVTTKLQLPSARRFARACQRLDDTIFRIIDERRGRNRTQSDFLSMLLDAQDPNNGALSDDQVRDEVATIFAAGHETVGNGLAWTWYLLSQNPEAETALHNEVETVLAGRPPTFEDMARLSYTRMVFSESMRLYPPVWIVGRRSSEDFNLGGYLLPVGSRLYMSQWVMHRDPRYYPEPKRFDPLRWTPEATAARPKFSYFPFGAGVRQCIGEGFAWTVGVLVIATIAQRWRMRLVPGHPVEMEPLITLRPKHGMRMILERRK